MERKCSGYSLAAKGESMSRYLVVVVVVFFMTPVIFYKTLFFPRIFMKIIRTKEIIFISILHK